MNFNELEKIAFKKDIQKLIEGRENFNGVNDCYCALVKQMMLSNTSLN